MPIICKYAMNFRKQLCLSVVRSVIIRLDFDTVVSDDGVGLQMKAAFARALFSRGGESDGSVLDGAVVQVVEEPAVIGAAAHGEKALAHQGHSRLIGHDVSGGQIVADGK